MTLARFRFGLAVLMVSLTPGTAFTWAQLYLSGFTYRDDGSRDLGHLGKAVAGAPGMALFMAVVVLVAGGGALVLARRSGPLTAPRLLSAGVGVAVVIGLACAGLAALGADSAGTSLAEFLPWSLAVVVACALTAALLALQFVVVAGVPFAVKTQPVVPGRSMREIDGVVITSAGAATAGALVWFAGLIAWSMQHPCNCG